MTMTSSCHNDIRENQISNGINHTRYGGASIASSDMVCRFLRELLSLFDWFTECKQLRIDDNAGLSTKSGYRNNAGVGREKVACAIGNDEHKGKKSAEIVLMYLFMYGIYKPIRLDNNCCIVCVSDSISVCGKRIFPFRYLYNGSISAGWQLRHNNKKNTSHSCVWFLIASVSALDTENWTISKTSSICVSVWILFVHFNSE